MSANLLADTVQNEILSDCNIDTNSVPMKIKYKHWMYTEYVQILMPPTSPWGQTRGLLDALPDNATVEMYTKQHTIVNAK